MVNPAAPVTGDMSGRQSEVDRADRSTYSRIYGVVRRIPPGCVATYGQVAELAGMRGHARLVGYALHSLPRGHNVPWHRVVNARGFVSLRTGDGGWGDYQRHLLQQEGVQFGPGGKIRLDVYQWSPGTAGSPAGGSVRTP